MDAEGPATQITRLTESPSDITWLPDGKSILFRMNVPASNRTNWRVENQLNTLRPRNATWTAAPRIVEKMNYRRDGTGFTSDAVSQLFIVTADGGTPRQITEDDYGVASIDLTPDGRTVLFSSGPRAEDGEYQWRESDIYAADLATGAIRKLTTRKGPDGNPAVSPDGKLVAYTGYDWTDDTWVDSRMYVMNIDGSGARVLTGSLDRSPASSHVGGRRERRVLQRAGPGVAEPALRDAAERDSRGHEGHAHAERRRDRAERERRGDSLGPDQAGRHRDVQRQASDGVQAAHRRERRRPRRQEARRDRRDLVHRRRRLEDPGLGASSRRDSTRARSTRCMLTIHGGPHAMYGVGFNFGWQEHAANGYVVLFTNPRGSTGYGSAFGNAIKRAYPGKDYDDLMAGVDAVIAKGYVDTQNMFVYGCSGGGVLTAWIVGHTDRFAAASSNCPGHQLVELRRDHGRLVVVPQLRQASVGRSQRAPAPLAAHVRENVKTPTMLMTGVNDLRTPISQTEEFYEALKVLKVPTAMIRFNEEWHGTSSKPSNFIRTQLYLREWFTRYARKATPVSD